jgi:hypothetical protein
MAEHHFHTPEPVELEIQIPVGDIRIETVDGDESYVSVTGSEKLVEQTSVVLVGNKLTIGHRGRSPSESRSRSVSSASGAAGFRSPRRSRIEATPR